MTAHPHMIAPAAMFIPNGAPVMNHGAGLTLTDDLMQMQGIAKRCPGSDKGWPAGSDVTVQTDGGILAMINGSSCWVELARGKISNRAAV